MKTVTNVVLKAKAKALREAMAKAGFVVKHTQALEILAAVENEKSWNILAAKQPVPAHVVAETANILEFIEQNHDAISSLCWNGRSIELFYKNGQQACPFGDPAAEFDDEDPVLFETVYIFDDLDEYNYTFRRSAFKEAHYVGNGQWELPSETSENKKDTVSFQTLIPMGIEAPIQSSVAPRITNLVELLNTVKPELAHAMLDGEFQEDAEAFFHNQMDGTSGPVASLWFSDYRGNETSFEFEQLEKAVYLGNNSWRLPTEDGDMVVLSELYATKPFGPDSLEILPAIKPTQPIVKPEAIVAGEAASVAELLVRVHLVNVETLADVDIALQKLHFLVEANARLQLKLLDFRFNRMIGTPTLVGANQASCLLALQGNPACADDLELDNVSVDVTGPNVAEFELMDFAIIPKPAASVVNPAPVAEDLVSGSTRATSVAALHQVVMLSMVLKLRDVDTVGAAEAVVNEMDYSFNSGTDGVRVVDAEIVDWDDCLPPVLTEVSVSVTIKLTLAVDKHQDETDIQAIIDDLDFTFVTPEFVEAYIVDYSV